MNSKKIILDTNLWVSFLISKDFSFLDSYILNGRIQIVFSAELYSEFITVTERPKFKKYFSKSDIRHLTKIINKHGLLVNVTTSVNKCRDFKDNFILNLAIDSNADYVVTGDNDLLELESIGKTKIVTISGLKEDIQ